MAREGAVEVEGVIVEVLPRNMHRVELANGHRLLGFVPGKVRSALAPLMPGDKVQVHLSLYDLSVGRIIRHAQTNKI